MSNTVKVFISYSRKDKRTAEKLHRELTGYGITVFIDKEGIEYGDEFPADIEKNIAECDHFLVVLSKHATESEWVGRELGLAVKLSKTKERRSRPCIIGIKPRGVIKGLPHSLQLRNYRTKAIRGFYSFENRHHFTVGKDNIRSLVQRLNVQITFVNDPDGDDRELMTKSIECYKQLFPIPEERDDPNDICNWIKGENVNSSQSPWRSIYAAMHTGGQVVGMAYLSLHLKQHWCFGNYFGLNAGWRQDNRAGVFLDELKARLTKIDPDWKGILFEAEIVDRKVLRRAYDALLSDEADLDNRSTRGKRQNLRKVLKTDPELRDHIRRLRRLFLYNERIALALVDGKGRPIPYRQPAMKKPLNQRNEVPLILMTVPNKPKSKVQARDALQFVYDDLFGDAYADGSAKITGYREYLDQVKQQVIDKAVKNEGRFDKLEFNKLENDVHWAARGHGLGDWNAL